MRDSMKLQEKQGSQWRAANYSLGKCKKKYILNFISVKFSPLWSNICLGPCSQWQNKTRVFLNSLYVLWIHMSYHHVKICVLLEPSLWYNSWMKTISDIKFIRYFHSDYATVFSCPVSEQNKIYRIVLSPNNFWLHRFISAAFDIEIEVTKSSFYNLSET